MHCAGYNAISEDLNGVKKKLVNLESHFDKIGRFAIKVMHSLATTMSLLHQEKLDQTSWKAIPRRNCLSSLLKIGLGSYSHNTWELENMFNHGICSFLL